VETERRFRFRGRGAVANPANRFDGIDYTTTHDDGDGADDAEAPSSETLVPTELLLETASSIITRNDSPDVGFAAGVNPYRGCEHGCAYCYARPTHEYLGFSAGLDFETKIVVKQNAAALLRKELSRSSWVPQPIGMSGVTDP
jgi:hypothetical protein